MSQNVNLSNVLAALIQAGVINADAVNQLAQAVQSAQSAQTAQSTVTTPATPIAQAYAELVPAEPEVPDGNPEIDDELIADAVDNVVESVVDSISEAIDDEVECLLEDAGWDEDHPKYDQLFKGLRNEVIKQVLAKLPNEIV